MWKVTVHTAWVDTLGTVRLDSYTAESPDLREVKHTLSMLLASVEDWETVTGMEAKPLPRHGELVR